MREKLALLVNNLALLGITDLAQSQLGIDVSSRTFTGLENHKKAGEVIWYCLFQALDPDECKQRLKSSFPCTDGRKSKDFRNAVFKWLNELKKTTKILGGCLVRRSLLDECAGERYEDLLFQLSTHVYLLNLSHGNPPDATFGSANKVICAGDASLIDLQVHDLVQTYRLCKLRQARQHQIQIYKSFNDKLREKEKQLSHDPRTNVEFVSIDDVSRTAQQQVARIKSKTSKSVLCNIIDPPPLVEEDFFRQLPWSKAGAVIEHKQEYRDLGLERTEVERHVKSLKEAIPIISTEAPQAETLETSDIRKKVKRVTSSLPRIEFKRPNYTQLKQRLSDELATLEPGYTPTLPAADDIERLRTLTPAKCQHMSHLPRPVAKREIVRVQENLQRTALKNRIKVFQQPASPFDEPVTPERTTTMNVTSTVKSINRLINLLNDSDKENSTSSPSLSRQPQTPVPYRGTNRSLEQSLSLWQTS